MVRVQARKFWQRNRLDWPGFGRFCKRSSWKWLRPKKEAASAKKEREAESAQKEREADAERQRELEKEN